MNMLSSLKALLFSSASPGVGAAQPAGPGDMADFAALFNGTMAEEAAVVPALPQTNAPAAPSALPGLPPVEGQNVAAATPDLPVSIDRPEANPKHGHVPHGLAIAVAVGKSLPSQLPPGPKLGLLANVPMEQQAPDEPAQLPVEAEAAPIPAQTGTPGETPVQPGAALPDQATPPAQVPTPRPAAHKGEVEQDPIMPVVEEASPVETKSPAKQKAKIDRTSQDPAAIAPVPQPLAADAIVPLVIAEPVTQAPPAADEPIAAAPDVAAIMAVPVPSARPVDPAPVPRASEGNAPDQRTATIDSQRPSAAPDALVTATAKEAPGSELVLPAAPVLNARPLKSEAIALLQIVREQVAARQTGASVRVGEQTSAAARAGVDASGRLAEPAFDPSIVSAPADATPATPPAVAPQTGGLSTASIAPASPSPDLSASLGAQVVDMGVSGQWIDGLARDIAGLSANGAQGRFQIDAHQLGQVQVDIRQSADGAAVSLTVASEAAEIALRQDSDRLKLDAGLAAVRISEVRIERAPVAETARSDMGGDNSQRQSSQQQGSQTASAWAQNSGGQNMNQSQGQQGRWQSRENSTFSPKTSGDPAVLNHAEARQGASNAARTRYA